MPCNSDYLAPSSKEEESRKCAQNILYVNSFLGKDIPTSIETASSSIYGDIFILNEMVVLLCKLCTEMTEVEKEAIIYDGHSKQARQLADWWEEHQTADKKRREIQSIGGMGQ